MKEENRETLISKRAAILQKINSLKYKTRWNNEDGANDRKWRYEVKAIDDILYPKIKVDANKSHVNQNNATIEQSLERIHALMGPRFPKNPRNKLSPRKYNQLCQYVWDRDQYCVFCGRWDNSTPAHVQRRSQGGHDSPQNVVRACVDCHAKFDRYEIELPEHIKEMLANEPETLPERN